MNKEKIAFLHNKLNYWYPKMEAIMKNISQTEEELIKEYKIEE